MKERPTMKEVYMDFARQLAKRSTCQELQVGAVIASKDFEQIYAVGYNGNAKGMRNNCDGIGWKNSCGCIHAEQNALIKCSVKDKEKVMFITMSPCSMCAKLIINSGFSEIYINKIWKDTTGLLLLSKAGIATTELILEDGYYAKPRTY